ncbi:MAG: hypothetical protein IJB96_03575 [Lachnospira sp.]|nr:hypothetical protein [Lachnospira sp.]
MKIKTLFHGLMSSMFAFMIFDIFKMNIEYPCILFLGEYEYPKESDYID